MRVSDYILTRLRDEGITHAFMVYGGAISELMDAFTRVKGISYVVAQHEQAAGFMAEGHAQVSGKPGCVIVTSGPGGGNIVTCLQNAYYNSVPLIAITGQVNTKFMRPPNSGLRQLGFQETPIVDIVRPITKYATTIDRSDVTKIVVAQALWECSHGRPGPVLLDIPSDLQSALVD